jgi:hypothetical protein
LKKVLSTLPVLVAPNEKEPLLLYIAATHQVESIVLVVERSEEGKAHGVQRLVYFLSEVYLQQNRGTCTIKNLHTVYSQYHESYGNISRCIQS